MSKVPNNLGKGEMGGSGGDLKTLMNEMIDDLTALRSAITGITAKLDADEGVTDTDYASLHDPAALKSTKSDY